MRLAQRDQSGDAIQGLKTSFSNYLFNQSLSDVNLPSGRSAQILNGREFYETLQDPKVKQAIMTLFTREERARFERAGRTAQNTG